MMTEKYKDDWLNLATKWLSESNNRFQSAMPDIQNMAQQLQDKYRNVGLLGYF